MDARTRDVLKRLVAAVQDRGGSAVEPPGYNLDDVAEEARELLADEEEHPVYIALALSGEAFDTAATMVQEWIGFTVHVVPAPEYGRYFEDGRLEPVDIKIIGVETGDNEVDGTEEEWGIRWQAFDDETGDGTGAEHWAPFAAFAQVYCY